MIFQEKLEKIYLQKAQRILKLPAKDSNCLKANQVIKS